MKYQNIDELENKITENDGVLTVSMEALRDAAGYDRLGVNVRNSISNDLLNRGIRHLPAELPSYQHELVRLFKAGTPVGTIIIAATEIGEIHDQRLRSVAASNAEDILRKVRALVEV